MYKLYISKDHNTNEEVFYDELEALDAFDDEVKQAVMVYNTDFSVQITLFKNKKIVKEWNNV